MSIENPTVSPEMHEESPSQPEVYLFDLQGTLDYPTYRDRFDALREAKAQAKEQGRKIYFGLVSNATKDKINEIFAVMAKQSKIQPEDQEAWIEDAKALFTNDNGESLIVSPDADSTLELQRKPHASMGQHVLHLVGIDKPSEQLAKLVVVGDTTHDDGGLVKNLNEHYEGLKAEYCEIGGSFDPYTFREVLVRIGALRDAA